MRVEANPSPSLADVSALFSSATYRSLASRRPLEAIERLRRVFPIATATGAVSVADAFEAAYATLVRDYRNEYVFKNAIISKIIFGRHRPTTASAILELPLGSSIADVAVFNGTSTVYEIKTDLDSFARLKSQLRDYSTRVEMVNVVVSDLRAAAAERHLPERVGLLALRRNGSLSVVRPAVSNLDVLRADHIFAALRQHEVELILQGQVAPIVMAHPIDQWQEMRAAFSVLPPAIAHAGAVKAFRARSAHVVDIASDPSVPSSVRALVYSAPLSAAGRRRLALRLNGPLPRVWGS